MNKTISNTASFNPKLFVGVKGYKMLLNNSCRTGGQCQNELVLSFELDGEFLAAAISDEITQTVNYAALCEFCRGFLTELPCHLLPSASSLGNALRQFSSQIQGGQLHLAGRAHDVFFNDYYLL